MATDAPRRQLIAHGLGDRVGIDRRVRGDLYRIVGIEALRYREVGQYDRDAVFLRLLDDGLGDRQPPEPHGDTLCIGPGDGLVGQRDEGVDGILVGGSQLTVKVQILTALQKTLLGILVYRMPRRTLYPEEFARDFAALYCRGGRLLRWSLRGGHLHSAASQYDQHGQQCRYQRYPI
jgi:hypothetical protein